FPRNGALASASYSEKHRFTYEYADHGALRECVYPDGQSVKFGYDRKRRLVASVCDDARFEYEYDDTGHLCQWSFRRHGKVFALRIPARAARLHLDIESDDAALTHALGSWHFGLDGRLEELLLPSGDRRRIHEDANLRRSVV